MQLKDHPANFLLKKSPNSFQTPSEFLSALVAQVLLHGNGFAFVRRSGGAVSSLTLLDGDDVEYRESASGALIGYTVGGVAYGLKDILHVKNFSLDGVDGLSAIEYGARVFGSALAGDRAASSAFAKGLTPTIALETDLVLDDDQSKALSKKLAPQKSALEAGGLPVFDNGIKSKVLSISAKDTQLLESRAFSVEEVCRWFGIDPSLVGHGGAVSNWGTGLEQKMIGFLTFVIRPILVRIEQSFNKTILLPEETEKNYYFEGSIEALLRADSAARATFYREMIASGVYTRDEVRVKENLKKMGGASAKQTIQSGFVLLESLEDGV